jgi:hypothetical protein
MKLCKDCRWIRPRDGEPPLCGHPTSVFPTDISRVTGEPIPSHPYTCGDMRYLYSFDNFCGREGKHWEQMEATPVGFT